ncbi:MAG: phage tail sheath C-terminal domain-containing protein [Ardenticatenaceae bacterium]|nr:phage tail sheath C-terminal domain-containing protein [Ardenticatenaceae bacterium]
MPVTPTYPGVYIEELPSGVRTIVGVATSITAFIGRAKKGPVNYPVRIASFGDYERVFGGLWTESPMSYAVRHFFQNGGTDAIIVRVENGALTADVTVGGFQLETAWKNQENPGDWGNYLSAEIDTDAASSDVFNLILRLHEEISTTSTVLATETFRNLSTDSTSSRYIITVLQQESNLARIVSSSSLPGTLVDDGPTLFTGGDEGSPITDSEIQGNQANKEGLYALEDVDLFNLLYIPPLETGTLPDATATLGPALDYCQERRAMLIIDPPPSWVDVATAESNVSTLMSNVGGAGLAINSMVYFPELRMPDPLRENRLTDFPPGGAMAGMIARTDANRGVWKAPAGIEASFVGVSEMAVKMTDPENGRLNPLGLNCLRTITPYGHISWGARTLAGDDRIASEWKYIPVRRTALYIEESLFRGLHWVVFEPNDESLWGQIRLNVGAFMKNMFRQGAFQGTSAREAYLVKCDAETNPQDQIDRGIVTVYVGFAPLKPAEFVIIQIQQLAGQLEV